MEDFTAVLMEYLIPIQDISRAVQDLNLRILEDFAKDTYGRRR